MGVEYKCLLIPADNSFRPSDAELDRLISGLVDERWLDSYSTAHVRTHSRREHGTRLDQPVWGLETGDAIVEWSYGNIAACHITDPFVGRSRSDLTEASLDVRIELSDDYVYRVSEQVDPFDDEVLCDCGTAVTEERPNDELFHAGRIKWHCPGCRKPIYIDRMVAHYRPFDPNVEDLIAGGATSRFALVLDCGKSIPSATPNPDGTLIRVCEQALKQPMYFVHEFY